MHFLGPLHRKSPGWEVYRELTLLALLLRLVYSSLTHLRLPISIFGELLGWFVNDDE